MVTPPSGMVRDNSTSRSAALVVGVAWLVSVPWAVLHGPVDPMWVVFQALGAAVIPMGAGWLTLWRTRGGLKGALGAVLGAAAVLLALEVYSLAR